MRKQILALVGVVGLVIIILALPIFLIRLKGEKQEAKVEKQLSVRSPAVEGAFYPAEEGVLSSQIETFLANVPSAEKRPTILIVPHAGYQYSGQVAAYGFKQLVNSRTDKVVLLGPSHQVPFEGAAIDDNGFWQTPLGQVAIDTDLASKMIASHKLIFAGSEYHRQEHSLEVEVPFLQKVLGSFKLVPILMGDKTEETINALVEILAKEFDSPMVLVVSSDLSHYPSYEDANKVDAKTIDAVLTGEVKQFDEVISESINAGILNLSTCACGEGPIKVGMKLAERLGIDDIRLLKYANSGDVTGDKERIVGYAAIGFYQERINDELNHEEQKELLTIARSTLEHYIIDRKIPEFEIVHPFLNRPLGAFVTLRKDGQLRGCIGQFEPDIPLWQVVRQKTIDAAVNDARFFPVAFEELDKIKIEISVLSPQRRIDDWREIELGKHGVVIKKGLRGGVFLPQVATENNWDLDKFMGELCSQKAGLPWDCWKKDDVDLYVFTAQVFEEEE